MRKKIIFLIPHFSLFIHYLSTVICSLLFVIYCFSSCTTFKPVDIVQEKPLIAETPQAVVPHWKPFAVEADGVLDLFEGKTIQPKLEFWAVRVDLSSQYIEIVTADGGRKENYSGAVSTKVSGFVRDNGLTVGINALPFDPSSDREGEYRSNSGIVISQGRILSPQHPDFDALIFYTDGSAAIIPQREIRSAINIENAVGGFYQILDDGSLTRRLTAQTSDQQTRHPRSAAGISADGKYLFLLVIDGRRPGSAGSTEAETAIILQQLGARHAINFDGGGSSALVLNFPGGSIRAVNRPIHGGIPGRERAVAGCLGVRFINSR